MGRPQFQDMLNGIVAYKNNIEYVKENIRQLTAAKERLGNQIDRLDDTDKHYKEKYNDMKNRIESLYDEIAEVSASLETVQMQIQGIREEQISQERVYEFLELFGIMYDKFTETEKKNFSTKDTILKEKPTRLSKY